MTLVDPYDFTASVKPSAAQWQTIPDAIVQLQGGTPTSGGALDYAALRQTVVQAVASGTFTSLTMDTEDIDVASGHSTVSNTSRYTAIQTGWFEAQGTAAFAANATGTRSCRFAINSTTVPASQTDIPATPGGLSASVSTFAVVYLTAGDYVECQGYQNSGGSLNTIASGAAASRMVVKWLHA